MIAIVLAGGRGSRLMPWHAPKCLLPINGVTILQRLLNHLRTEVSGIVICTGYRAGDVEAAIYNGNLAGTNITFSHAGENASMGQRLLAVRDALARNRVLICYGDELADVDVPKLVEHHEHNRNGMTFCVAMQRVAGGLVDKERGRLRIVEDDRVPINIGFVVVEPECWEDLRAEDGLSSWLNRVGDRGRLGMYLHMGKRATVNSLADLGPAEETWV